MKGRIWICFMVCIIAAAALFGCGGGTKVVLKQENYVPAFRAADYSRFKGKTVIMDNFTNQAANTKRWGYYSADNNFYYEATTYLESHLWYCFQKAFQHAGMKVFDQTYGYGAYPYWWGVTPPPARQNAALKDAVEFQLILMSMTDQESKFQVLLFRGGEQKFQKDYTVTMPAPSSQDPNELEKNAYRLIDQMVTTVFKDKEFRKVF
ncbi:MAG: hypothetical protein A4E72_02356 [Syntrophus sp. PtaU1.Bin208]|nr:MAG: hypothetical protein A4E72_02356 [Syntrophus sp. PtaU1.Bin208]